MVVYIYPQWKQGDIEAIAANPTLLSQWINRLRQADESNRRCYNQLLKAHVEMMKLAVAIYGEHARQVAYLRQNKPEAPASNEKRIPKLRRKIDEQVAILRQREVGRQRYRRRKVRIDEAIKLLRNAGYEMGVDWFGRERTLRFLENVTEQIEISPDEFEQRVKPKYGLPLLPAPKG